MLEKYKDAENVRHKTPRPERIGNEKNKVQKLPSLKIPGQKQFSSSTQQSQTGIEE